MECFRRVKMRCHLLGFLSGLTIGVAIPCLFMYQEALPKFPPFAFTSTKESEIADTKLACLVATYTKQHATHATAVKSTWGRRCHLLTFMSDSEDLALQSVDLKVTNGRMYLWGKTKAMFKYANEHLLDKANWFMKVDDDAYIIMENLLRLLSNYDHTKPLYIGCHLKARSHDAEFMAGGSAYVLSSAALKLFAKHYAQVCETTDKGEDEDVKMGRCMGRLNVTFVDGRDELGRMSFVPMTPGQLLRPTALPLDNWLYELTVRPVLNNPGCCSDRAISFHWIHPDWMYAIEYLLYNVKIN